jgi:competence protein ComEC
MCGILLGRGLSFHSVFIFIPISVGVVFILADYVGFLRGVWYLAALNILMVFTGIGLMQLKSHDHEAETVLKNHVNGRPLVAEIKEVQEGATDWTRVVGEVRLIHRYSGLDKGNAKLLLFLEKKHEPLKKGDKLVLVSELNRIVNKGNPGEFDAAKYWGDKGIGLISFASEDQYEVLKGPGMNLVDQLTSGVREYCMRTIKTHFKGQEAAVLAAIVLGEKSLLDTETKENFKNTGAMHVLAVSGLHIGLILYLLMFVLERFSKFINRRTALLSLILFFWFYAFLTGSSPSVVRAVFMFSMLVVSQFVSRKYDPLNILFFTAFVLMVFDPYVLYDIGFQLSYLAMFGIFVFYKPIYYSFEVSNYWLRKGWEGTAIGFAAQIMTTPLSLYYFNQFPNYFIVSNLGLMITSGLILGMGIAFLVFARIPGFNLLLVAILNGVLWTTNWFLSWVESWPGAVAYGFTMNIWQVILIGLGTLFMFGFLKSKFRLALSAVFLISGISWITIARFDRMDHVEFRVFNHSEPVMIYKIGSKIHCFYLLKDRSKFDKVILLAENYVRLYPGEIAYHDLDGKRWNMSTDKEKVFIEDRGLFILISHGERNYCIRKSNGSDPVGVNADFTVGMPWVVAGIDHSLSAGSVKLF